MGVGASNISTSDLNIYQSAVTKISQDLINSATNVSSINLNSNQVINFTNGCNGPDCYSGDVLGCLKRADDRLAAINLCQCGQSDCSATFPPSSPNAGSLLNPGRGSCGELVYDHIISFDQYETCQNNCSANALKLFPDCTVEEGIAERATLNCSVNINQNSNQNASTTQIADATVNAQMTSQIQNQFESQIDKTINQTNRDLNFSQFNTSTERTNLSQSVLNEVSNSISNVSKNLSSTYINGTQTINFTNSGIINCQGCGPQQPRPPNPLIPVLDWPADLSSGSCAINVNQTSIQTAITDQKATAALASVFNSSALNNLSSKYTLTVAQTNAGVDLLSLLLPIIAIAIVIIAVGFAIYMATGGGKTMMYIVIAVVVLVVILLGIFLGLVLPCPAKLPNIANQMGISCAANSNSNSSSVSNATGSVTGLYIIDPGSGFSVSNNICGWDTTNHLQSNCSLSTNAPTSAPTNAPTSGPTSAPLVSIPTQGQNLLVNITGVNGTGGITAVTIANGGSLYALNSIVYIKSGSSIATLEVISIKPSDLTLCSGVGCLVKDCASTSAPTSSITCNCSSINGVQQCCSACPT